ncbi:MAG: hypothetical protein IPG76_24045 [Acidobacteria bacterium]|nr:hypothetical protein [Acidobacteriota bacterium]
MIVVLGSFSSARPSHVAAETLPHIIATNSIEAGNGQLNLNRDVSLFMESP